MALQRFHEDQQRLFCKDLPGAAPEQPNYARGAVQLSIRAPHRVGLCQHFIALHAISHTWRDTQQLCGQYFLLQKKYL